MLTVEKYYRMRGYENSRNKSGNLVVRFPSGRVVEYEHLQDGGAKPVTIIEPSGQVYFESDLDRARAEKQEQEFKINNTILK